MEQFVVISFIIMSKTKARSEVVVIATIQKMNCSLSLFHHLLVERVKKPFNELFNQRGVGD
jgi:hypothetical protein